MKEKLGIAVGLLGFVVLSWFCARHHMLQQGSLPATVSAPPPLATPETPLPSEAPAEAPTPVPPGVTETAPSSTQPSTPQGPPPSLVARMTNGVVTLSGMVPDEDIKAKILARATEVYGAGKFTDDLKVSNREAAVVSPENNAWLTSVFALLPFVIRAGENSKLTVYGTTVALIGQVASDAARTALRQELSSAAGNSWNVAESLTVVALPPSPPSTTSEAKLQQAIDHTLEGKVIEFFMGSDVITAKGRAVLDSLVPLLQRTPNAQIEIAGHTDNVGTEDYNLDLSQRRANAVRRYFIAKGIPATRITTQGYGALHPIADNTTVQGRWHNRRTEILVHSTTTTGN